MVQCTKKIQLPACLSTWQNDKTILAQWWLLLSRFRYTLREHFYLMCNVKIGIVPMGMFTLHVTQKCSRNVCVNLTFNNCFSSIHTFFRHKLRSKIFNRSISSSLLFTLPRVHHGQSKEIDISECDLIVKEMWSLRNAARATISFNCAVLSHWRQTIFRYKLINNQIWTLYLTFVGVNFNVMIYTAKTVNSFCMEQQSASIKN